MRVEPSEVMAETLKTRQGWAGRLLDLAEFLDPADRALIRGVYRLGMTAAEFARVVERHPRTLRIRVRRIIDRITSPCYQRIIAQRRHWPQPRRRVAEAVFLQGLPQRKAAKRLGVSIHQIRRESDRIRAFLEADLAAESRRP